MAGFDLYPAIDLRGGRCVRLYQGDYGQETVYGDDPVAQARAFAAAGAPWIHVVDLDAARTGDPRNRARRGRRRRRASTCRCRPAAACATTPPPTRCSTPACAGWWSAPRRSTTPTGSAAWPPATRAGGRRPRRPGPRRGGAGLGRGLGARPRRRGPQFEDAGVAALVVTEIGRDGTLAGPDLDQLAAVLAATQLDVIASGGVGSLDDLRALAALAVGGRRLPGPSSAGRSTRAPFDRGRGSRGDRRVRSVRVIPCLDVDAGRVVKGVNFVGLRDAGDPVELAARYDAEGADELVFLDITASSDARDTMVEVARRTAEEVFIPFTVGRRRALGRRRPPAAAGRRRQGVGQHRRRRPPRAGDRAGRRVRRPVRGRGHRRPPAGDAAGSRCTPTAAARRPASTPSRGPGEAAASGAGEILLTSMDRDGTRDGFDLELTRAVSRRRARARDRQRRRRHARPPGRGRDRGRRRRRAGRLDLPLRRAHGGRGQGRARRAGVTVRPV